MREGCVYEVAGEISAGKPEETGCDEDDRPFGGNRGEVGGDVIERSREIRLVAATDMPASCNDRMRSLMLLPTFLVDTSVSSLITVNRINHDTEGDYNFILSSPDFYPL